MGNLAAARAHDFNETANDGSISAGRTMLYTHKYLKRRTTGWEWRLDYHCHLPKFDDTYPFVSAYLDALA